MDKLYDKKYFIILFLILCVVYGCTQLKGFNTALANQSMGVSMPSMSERQVQELRTNLSSKIDDVAIYHAREETKPNLEKILTISACYSGGDMYKYLAAYSVPGEMFFPTPMFHMQYHPKSQCLTVSRLDSWKMLAKNAFSFRAIFISEASSESASANYQMVKQPDGVWLLR